jgi:hypothetical protein
MANYNHKKSVKEARKELDPIVRELKGLTFFALSLQNTLKMADFYTNNLDNLGHESCLAFTKAIVVDYGRLWKSTSNKFIKNLDKSFLSTTSRVHEELLELRDRLVAHPDKGFESIEVRISGSTAVNNPRKENTHENVFITLNARAEVKDPMWWINDKNTSIRIRDHIKKYLDLVYKKLSTIGKSLVLACQMHSHVVSELGDIMSTMEYEIENADERKRPNIWDGPFAVSEPHPLKIGRSNLACTIGIWESANYFPKGEVRGPGFVIRVTDVGKLNVSFPPHSNL